MMRRLAVALLLCTLFGCPAEPPGPPDFDQLAAAAFPKDSPKDAPAGLRLWTALFKQPTWYFLGTGDPSNPAVDTVNGQSYLLVFTDMTRLQAFAKLRVWKPLQTDAGLVMPQGPDGGTLLNPFMDVNGKAYVVSMDVEHAVSYLQHYQGAPVAGVRFNEGSSGWGWSAPIDTIMTIRGILQKNGRL